ncbi:YbhB/YbcL family Raf kinase inhibitor-like protein [Thermosulfurimonas marina]|uniref:YbhB/YbcL family Raf kinase inhibitor-like protein n=1 Tax=Thermosulfurimonas marina TaxID=2047767 RepID=A0A6H1WSF8_9BACT|nr:YbhB/YbcL family Raf kinase inhibitor-like protein [Thermosulfurimonas marina]QJA06108.1 YbhB/YbcL family Raf kinase inhibitor-like protein [Thermosulfurimonas marina]
MKIWSPTIPAEGTIPKKYVMRTIGGKNLSPPLKWEGVPAEARSLVLVCVDTHPVARNWIHWVVINLPPETLELPEGASGKDLPAGARELVNSYGFSGWGGPQPPQGTGPHPYHFILYALDVERVELPERPSFAEIERYLKDHILAKASFTAYYER